MSAHVRAAFIALACLMPALSSTVICRASDHSKTELAVEKRGRQLVYHLGSKTLQTADALTEIAKLYVTDRGALVYLYISEEAGLILAADAGASVRRVVDTVRDSPAGDSDARRRGAPAFRGTGR